jgi:hypothetical protein
MAVVGLAEWGWLSECEQRGVVGLGVHVVVGVGVVQ